MEIPFFFSNDPGSAAARRRPSGRGTQRPLFYVAYPWIAYDYYICQTDQPPESVSTRAREPAPATGPRLVSIPIDFVRPAAAAIPAGPIRPEISKSGAAAIAVQRVFRGHLVRKNIELVSQVAFEVGEIEGRIHADEARLRVNPKEWLRMNEMLMAQLLRLDSVRWVREYRRKAIRKVIALQEFLDGISVQFMESPNSVNSQATAEMNSNYVDSSDMSNDVVSNMIPQDAICAVAEDVSEESKDPILGIIQDGEDAEKRSDANVFDEGFESQDPLTCRNDSEEEEEEEEEEERISEDEEFVVIAAEKATCNSPVDPHSQKDQGLKLTGKAMEEVVQLPEDSARMTVETGNGSTEVAAMEEVLKKVMAESERLQGLVATLCERNTEQCRLMAGLEDRVGNLERAVQRMEKRNKKEKSAHCSPLEEEVRRTKQCSLIEIAWLISPF